jgi:hypothetical protein
LRIANRDISFEKGRSLRLSEDCIFFWIKCIIDTGGFALYQKGTWVLKSDKTDAFFIIIIFFYE